MAKLADVAERAGVSISTVSRVINRPEMVDAQTRSEVEDVLKEVNYRPSRVARRLKNDHGEAQLLGVIIPDIQNPFYSEIVRGIEDVASARGYAVILCNTDEDRDREQFYLDVLHGESADGVILPPLARDDAAGLNVDAIDLPVVCFDRRLPGDPVDTVVVDNRKGAREMTRHLLDLGHERIGLICGPDTLSTSTERLEGYRDALQERGIPIDEDLIYMGPPRRETGRASAEKLLASERPPTAIFAANNQLLLGTFESVQDRNLHIPQDVAVVGFDDTPWAKFFNPPLTTVRQPTYQIGKQAAECLFSRIETPDQPARLITLDPTLKVRRSCGTSG